MSKRRSESNFNSKEENFDESNSKHKRRKLNEEGDDGSFEDISDADNCDVITPDEPCDQLLNIFFRIITDLHQYNKGGTISRKSQRGQDMKKLELVEMNHDESVRLEQEADELELKTSKDKDKYKESKTILPKESKEESHKRLEDENEVNYRNYQLQTLQALTNMTYYDPRKFLKENEESNSQLHILICKLIYKRKNKKNWLLNSEFKSKLVDSPKNCDEPKEIKEKLQQKSNFIPQQQTIKEEVPKQISPPIPENIQIPPMSQAMNIPKNNIPQSLSPEIVMGAIKSSNQPMQNQMLMNLFNKSSMKFSNPMNRNTQSPNVMQMMQQQSSLPSQNYQLPGLTNVGLNLEKNKMLPVSNPFPYMPMN